MVECSPLVTVWLRVRVISVNPASASWPVYSAGGEGACDAVGVGAHAGAVLGGEVIVGDQVADADAAAGSEDAVDLAEDCGFVRGEVDDAVGDDDVDAGVG